jgi:hypothetical protein
MKARKRSTATCRSVSVPWCATWLMPCLALAACLNPWPDEYPQSAPVSESSPPNSSPGLAGQPGPDHIPLFPDHGSVDDEDTSSGVGGGSTVTPPPPGTELDAGVPPSDAGLTVTAPRRTRRLGDAGADAE